MVYGAELADKQRFAVKALHDSVSSEKTRRFKNEILFGVRNYHKNIAAVIDHGIATIRGTERPFYVMPRYKETLREVIERRVPADKVLAVFGNILDGVETAHLLKIVHRDLKPANILIDHDGTPLVADFGIARFSAEHLATIVKTKPATRLANARYAAPEQLLPGGDVDHRADIFALGLLLNEMFTGSVPHGTGYQTIAQRAPSFGFLDALVESMIAQSPDRRPSSIAEVKNALIAREQEHIAHQKVDTLRRQVVRSAEVDDPVARSPIMVTGGEWDGSNLRFRLSAAPPAGWIRLVSNRANAGPYYPNFRRRLFSSLETRLHGERRTAPRRSRSISSKRGSRLRMWRMSKRCSKLPNGRKLNSAKR